MGVIGLGHITPVRGVAAHPETFPFPTLQRELHDENLISLALRAEPALYPSVLAAATDLVTDGATCILTTCGYFTPYQTDLSQALPVPVLTSSLLQLPSILTMVGADKVLVVAADAERIDARCLAAAGVPDSDRLVVIGMEGAGPFRDQVLTAGRLTDIGAIVVQTVQKVQEVLSSRDDIRAICLECGDLSVAAATLRSVTSLPVLDYVTAAHWLYEASTSEETRTTPDTE